MIQRVSFENFRLFQKATVDLEQLTVLVGPNGSGKSTVLEGLACLSMLTTQEPKTVLCGTRHPDLLLTRGVSDRLMLGAVGTSGQEKWRMFVLLQPPQDSDHSNPGQWRISIDTEEMSYAHRVLQTIRLDELQPGTVGVPPPASDQLRSNGVVRFEIDKLAAPAPSDVPTLEIGKDGTGLAAVLAEIAAIRPDDLRLIETAVRTVVPSVRKLKLRRAEIQDRQWVRALAMETGKMLYQREETRRWGFEIVLDCESGSDIPASCISEGTLIVLAILSLIMQPNRPNLLLIENIEQGLHPRAIGDLVSHLRTLLTQYPQMQIVATSHSPYLIDHLRPEEVRLTYYDSQQGGFCVPLKEHPDFDRWKEAMSPGEFWSSVGEKWVKDQAGAVHG